MLGEHSDFKGEIGQVGLADFGRMQIDSQQFRNNVPPWSQSDQKVRLVVYHYVWRYIDSVIHGHTQELKGAPLSKLERIAKTECREMILKRMETTYAKWRPKWEEHLRITECGIATHAVRLIHAAYRRRLKGPDIAEELEMDHRAVRQTLFRLNTIARCLFPASECMKPGHRTLEPDLKKKFMMIGRQRWYKQDFEKWADRYNAGESLKELSIQSGIKMPTLYWGFCYYKLIADNRKTKQMLRLTPETKLIADKFNSGSTLEELAKEFDMTIYQIRNRIKKFGLKTRKTRGPDYGPRKKTTKEDMERYAALRRAGWTYAMIAAEDGINQFALMKKFKRWGLQDVRRGEL